MRKRKKDDSNSLGAPLQEISKDIIRAWKHRDDIKIPIINKTFKNTGKVAAVVQDVIDNLWKDSELKPLVVKKDIKDHKHTFIIHLPPGVISYKDFKAKENYFYDAVNGQVLIERRGISVILTVLEGELGTNIPYQFDPSLYPNMFLPLPVGIGVNGLVVRDLAEFPYMLIGGLPGFGKSNQIHVINVALLTGRSESCYIVTIDFKKSTYANYMNTNGLLVTDEQSAYKALLLLEKELERRMDYFVKINEREILEIKDDFKRPPFIVIEIDEITELQHKPSQLSLNRIMRLGRSYGFCAILATQKPSAKTFRNETFTETRSLCAARMCFNVRSNEDSTMILNNTKGLDIPSIKGRGIFQFDKELEVQSMFLNTKKNT